MVSDKTDMCISDSNEESLPSAELSEIDSDIEDDYDPCEGSSYTEKLYVVFPLGMLESHLLIFQHAVRHSITNEKADYDE